MPDVATFEVDELIDYEPDALVTCGDETADDAVAAPNPIIVVEVLSPASRAVDAGVKLSDYLRVFSIQHYLIVRTDRQEVVHHHRRRGDNGLATDVFTSGPIHLDSPGLTVSVEGIYAASRNDQTKDRKATRFRHLASYPAQDGDGCETRKRPRMLSLNQLRLASLQKVAARA